MVPTLIKIHCWGSVTKKKQMKTSSRISEKDVRINKQPNITCKGPQCPSGNAWPLPIMML